MKQGESFGRWLCQIYSRTCLRFDLCAVSNMSSAVNRIALINQSLWYGIRSCYWNGLANHVTDVDHLSLCGPSIELQQRGVMSAIESVRDVSKTAAVTRQPPCERAERNICAGLFVRTKLMTQALQQYTPTGD
jgi:hypothetical protein